MVGKGSASALPFLLQPRLFRPCCETPVPPPLFASVRVAQGAGDAKPPLAFVAAPSVSANAVTTIAHLLVFGHKRGHSSQ